MDNCNNCKFVEGTLFDALESIVWYDCHYEWLKELRDRLRDLPEDEVYTMPKDIEWHTEKHTIMMLLVGMFGDWGTSIRGGCICNKEGCIAFIERLCEDYWDEEEQRE